MFPFAHSVPSAGFALRGWYVLHLLRSCTLWMRIHVLVFPNSNNNLVQFIISGIGVCLGIHHLLLSASLDISYPKKCIPFFFFFYLSFAWYIEFQWYVRGDERYTNLNFSFCHSLPGIPANVYEQIREFIRTTSAIVLFGEYYSTEHSAIE